MTHHPEIWACLVGHMPRGRWVSLREIYSLVAAHLVLDREDHEPEAPGSSVPKWKRNVRNVLQYRRKTREIKKRSVREAEYMFVRHVD